MTLSDLQAVATVEQINALRDRAHERGMPLADFLRIHNARYDALFHTIFYTLYGMTVGVETDGYTHS